MIRIDQNRIRKTGRREKGKNQRSEQAEKNEMGYNKK